MCVLVYVVLALHTLTAKCSQKQDVNLCVVYIVQTIIMHTLTALPLLVYRPCFCQVQETCYRLFVIELIVIHNSLTVTERDLYYS